MNENIGLNNNNNSICYLNSIIQSLISFNEFINIIKENKEEYLKNNNDIGLLFFNIILKKEKGIKIEDDNYILSKKLEYEGQQCAYEALIKIIDKLKIDDMFKIIYEKSIYCTKCEKITKTTYDTSNIYENFIESKENLSNIINKNLNTIEDYKCDNCNKKVKQVIINNLIETNDIFIILYNQYFQKKKKKYDNILNLYTGNYKLITKIEHIGNIYGGHYWMKKYYNDKIIIIDDINIREDELKNDNKSKFTYLLFYKKI